MFVFLLVLVFLQLMASQTPYQLCGHTLYVIKRSPKSINYSLKLNIPFYGVVNVLLLPLWFCSWKFFRSFNWLWTALSWSRIRIFLSAYHRENDLTESSGCRKIKNLLSGDFFHLLHNISWHFSVTPCASVELNLCAWNVFLITRKHFERNERVGKIIPTNIYIYIG